MIPNQEYRGYKIFLTQLDERWKATAAKEDKPDLYLYRQESEKALRAIEILIDLNEGPDIKITDYPKRKYSNFSISNNF